MPIENETEMTAREFKTLKRFDVALKSSQILKTFFDNGFKSYDALKAIVQFYYPKVDEAKLWDFWHFRSLDGEIVETLENVFEKLKES